MDILKLIKEHYSDTKIISASFESIKTIKAIKDGVTFYYIIDDDKLLVINDVNSKQYNRDSPHYKKFTSMFREIKLNEVLSKD